MNKETITFYIQSLLYIIVSLSMCLSLISCNKDEDTTIKVVTEEVKYDEVTNTATFSAYIIDGEGLPLPLSVRRSTVVVKDVGHAQL